MVNHIERPFQAYDGDEPYIFICYKHADSELVYPMIKKFNDAGFNIWYDDGLQFGSNYADLICDKIEGSSLFVICLTETVIDNAHKQGEFMRHELSFAVDEVPIFPIFLDNVKLKSTYKLYLQGLHSIFKHEFESEETFIQECERSFIEDFRIQPR